MRTAAYLNNNNNTKDNKNGHDCSTPSGCHEPPRISVAAIGLCNAASACSDCF